MSQVYIVRHGNTFDKGDVIRRVGGRTDLPLSISGQAQSQALAEHFAPLNFSAAYTSPLKRQWQTAQAIMKAQNNPPSIETLETLREIDYGPDENKAESDVISRIGQTAMTAWDEHAHPPQGWDINPDEIRQNWRDFLKVQCCNSGPALVVTSNGIARFILDIADHADDMPRKLRTGAYGIIDLAEDKLRLIAWDVRPA